MEEKKNATASAIPSPFPPPLAGGQAQAAPVAPGQEPTPEGQAAPALLAKEPEEPIPPDQAVAPAPVTQQGKPKDSVPASQCNVTSAANYFMSGAFVQDVAGYKACGNRKTGYANLDRIQPFYPGFYVIGAISSLGKTTFAYQTADQLAAGGEGVLYFSLEQSRFELLSKSLARGFYNAHEAEKRQNGTSSYPTPSSIDIRRGVAESHPAELEAQIDAYVNMTGNRLFIIDGAFSLTVEDIVKYIEMFISATGGYKPVAIIDYLQIIAASTVGSRPLEAKASIDHIVHALKAVQSKYGMTVILISSLNRANYTAPVDFESFKESGGIEYTADVVWGLQLAAMDDELFAKEGRTKEKRDKLRDAKAATPRAVDLVCLKNRYGRSSYKAAFNYFPASDIFVPTCSMSAGIAIAQSPQY